MKNSDFMIGCNYWASNAGAEMWNNWDEHIVEDDLRILSDNGIKYLRVFPNWHDFQPVHPVLRNNGGIIGYQLENNEVPDNPYYLSREMLNRFEKFCTLCEKYNLKLIVGLLTGWMSGRLFIPPALYEKNLISDHLALYFEQLFIKGFVKEFKSQKAIYAWDLGNECGCMSETDSFEKAAVWTMSITDAIKSSDQSRPIISGIHGMSPSRYNNVWTIQTQAQSSDYLVSHPYPFWSGLASYDKISSAAVKFYPIALTKIYSDIGNKPCLMEEIGTMGPSVCNDKNSELFFKIILFSAWENNIPGVLWWCAHEQNDLKTIPYSWNMCETELGILNEEKKPKQIMNAVTDFQKFINGIDFSLPKPKADAVCILTHGQDQLGVGYTSYVFARQSGINIDFHFCDDELCDSEYYILPSYTGINIMPKDKYISLIAKIKKGAKLFISYNGGILSGFEELTGLSVIETEQGNFCEKTVISGYEIEYSQKRKLLSEPTTAEVLAKDSSGNPVLSRNKLGLGEVYFCAFAPEALSICKNSAFERNMHEIYKLCFNDILSDKPIKTKNDSLFVTEHYKDDELYCVICNYSNEDQSLDVDISPDYVIKKTYNAENMICKACESVVFVLKRI